MEIKHSNHKLTAKAFMHIRLRLFDYATSHSLEEVLQKTLDEIEMLTKSSIGFYHFVEKDQKTLSLQAWSTRTLNEFCKAEGKGMHYGIDQAGVWVDCVHQRRPVIHNDYASLPLRKGLPEGHAAIERELVVPVIKNDLIVAILGVGNKPVDYTQEDVEVVSFLADVAHVIAEQKRLVEELSYEKEKLSVMLRSIGDGVIATDFNGRVVLVNKVAEALTGWMQEEACGRPLSEVFHIIKEHSRERSESPHDNIMKAGGIVELADHTILISRNGTERPIADSGAPVFDNTNDLLGTVLVFRDQTKERKARQAIERQQQLLSAISRGQTRFITGNHPAALFDGILSDLLALTDSQYGFIGEVLFSPEGHPYLKTHAITNIAWNKETQVFYDQNVANGLEFRNLKTLFGATLISGEPVIANDPLHDSRSGGLPEGHPTVNAFLGIPIHLNGKMIAMVGIANRPGGYDQKLLDFLNPFLFSIAQIVEAFRHQAERESDKEALRQNMKQYRSLFNSIRDAILVANTDRTIIDCNPAFNDLFGYTKKEIVGKQTLTIYESEATFREMGVAIKDHMDDSEFLFPGHYKKADGSVFPSETSVFYLRDEEGTITGFIGMIRDVTKRKLVEAEKEKLQTQLNQAQKMESVGRLAGGVAHDFNNMLSVIIGYAQLGIAKTNPEDELHDDLKEILTAAERSTDITRQLLAFARKQTIAPKIIDLNKTVESMLKMLQRLIGEDIDLSWQPFSGLWPVNMDPSQIDQLLANLLVNARDAIEGVGKITIESDNVTFDDAYCDDHAGFVPGDFVLLAVSDNGHGMDKKTMDKIFEPFYTTKEVGKGTGLGLSTVYGIVKQNEGFINVYSEPGKGTTFKIYLPPLRKRAGVIKVQPLTELPKGLGETVLIVEDETSILKLAKTILDRLGYNVLEASTPVLAMDIARKHKGKINLLITDVVMPGMNGRDLAGNLQTHDPELKVLFMSGYTADVIAHQGVLEEGVHFMQKPFSNQDLAVKVREALEGVK